MEESSKQKVDLKGKHFNHLDVEDWCYSETMKCRAWKCKCCCGKEVFKTTHALTSGKAKSCGCMDAFYKSQARKKDLTGQRFGRLFVLEEIKDRFYTPQGIPQIKYKCLCDCGNIVEVYAGNLRKGNTKSCGCLNTQLISERRLVDITGERYGLLTAVKRVENQVSDSGNPHTMWLCRCDCGNETVVNACSLRRGLTKSCGCIKNSLGETIVKACLTKHSINFETEYNFHDLISARGYPLRFDFAIFDEHRKLKCLIEFQGLQHYVDFTYGSESFGKYQREVSDKMKKDYCRKNNIKLYEIRYDEDIEKAVDSIVQQMSNTNMSTPCQASKEEGVTTIP